MSGLAASALVACAGIIGADFDHGAASDGSEGGAADGATTGLDAASSDGATGSDAQSTGDAGADASKCTGDVCIVGSTSLTPVAITVVGGALYFTARPADADASTGEVIRLDLDGGAKKTIVSGLRDPRDVLVNGGFVFFVSRNSPAKVDGYGSIGQAQIDGGARAIAVQGIEDSVTGLAQYRGRLVWAAPNLGLVYELLPGNGTIHLITDTYMLGGLTSDSLGVYVSSSEYAIDSTPALVYVTDIDDAGLSTRTTTLYSYVSPTYLGAVATDATNLIYADTLLGTINVTDKKYGGPPKVIAEGLNSPAGITTDSQGHVYFITEGTADAGYSDGTVMRTGVDGGAATPIATTQKRPVSLALDATHIYWANAGDGTIMSAPR